MARYAGFATIPRLFLSDMYSYNSHTDKYSLTDGATRTQGAGRSKPLTFAPSCARGPGAAVTGAGLGGARFFIPGRQATASELPAMPLALIR